MLGCYYANIVVRVSVRNVYNTDVNVVNNLWNKNMETFVFFKNDEECNDFSR